MSTKLSDEIYEVEAILDKKIENRKCFYLVHWKGYPKEEATWQSRNNITLTYYFNMYDAQTKKKTKNNIINANVQEVEKKSKVYKKKQFGVKSNIQYQKDMKPEQEINFSKLIQNKEKLDAVYQQSKTLNYQQINNGGFEKMASQTDKKNIQQSKYNKVDNKSNQQIQIIKSQFNIPEKNDKIKRIKKIIKSKENCLVQVQYQYKKQQQDLLPYHFLRKNYPHLIIDYLQNKFVENDTRNSSQRKKSGERFEKSTNNLISKTLNTKK